MGSCRFAILYFLFSSLALAGFCTPFEHLGRPNDVRTLLRAADESAHGSPPDTETAQHYLDALAALHPTSEEDLALIFEAFAAHRGAEWTWDVTEQAAAVLLEMPREAQTAVWSRVLMESPEGFVVLQSLNKTFAFRRLLETARTLNADGSIERACNRWLENQTDHEYASFYPTAMETLRASSPETEKLLTRLALRQHPLTETSQSGSVDLQNAAQHTLRKLEANFRATTAGRTP